MQIAAPEKLLCTLIVFSMNPEQSVPTNAEAQRL